MKRLLHWFANRRRPDAVDESALYWHLPAGLSLLCCFDSDSPSDPRPIERDVVMLMLSGEYPRRITVGRKDHPLNICLAAAARYEDGLLDCPNWMRASEVIKSRYCLVWFLVR